MFTKAGAIRQTILAFVLGSTVLLGQATQPPLNPTSVAEFPVVMQQRVEAGKTTVGTKVEAKLVVATMVDGTVVPRDATFSGEVIESVAKSGTAPSRLAIRMDSAQWKSGSAPIKVYLTSWFYPLAATSGQNLSYEPADAARSNKNWNGMGPYPTPGNPVSQEKFPGRDSGNDTGLAPASPSSNISEHRVLMKNVERGRASDGTLTLSSTHSNIKLDKTTTYVLAASDLLPKN